MENKKRTVGTLVLQIALGLLFIVSGIWTLQNGKGDEIASAIHSVFNKDLAQILCIVFGIIEIVAGVFLLLRLFVFLNTSLDTLLMIIIMICWLAAIIMIDFVGNDGLLKNLDSGFLGWLNRFAKHLLILGAVIKVKD
mgnify:FL=1